jgi:hypothetical protein
MKDLLRFDTVVAVCALLISSITAAAMVYQTRVLQDQFSATVWPYLAVTADYGERSVDVRLINEGVGPALIRSGQVWIDGKPVSGWNRQFFVTPFGPHLTNGPRHSTLSITDVSIDASSAIRAGDERTLIAVRSSRPQVLQSALKHDVALAFCYCSINSKCWMLKTSLKSSAAVPQAVGACAARTTIAAPFSPFSAIR